MPQLYLEYVWYSLEWYILESEPLYISRACSRELIIC